MGTLPGAITIPQYHGRHGEEPHRSAYRRLDTSKHRFHGFLATMPEPLRRTWLRRELLALTNVLQNRGPPIPLKSVTWGPHGFDRTWTPKVAQDARIYVVWIFIGPGLCLRNIQGRPKESDGKQGWHYSWPAGVVVAAAPQPVQPNVVLAVPLPDGINAAAACMGCTSATTAHTTTVDTKVVVEISDGDSSVSLASAEKYCVHYGPACKRMPWKANFCPSCGLEQ